MSKKSGVTLIIIPNEKYLKETIKISKELAASSKQICYVTLNRPYASLVKTFKDSTVDVNKFVFIDGVTKTVSEKTEKVNRCIFVKSPYDLIGIEINITKSLENCDSLLFDSLSTLLVYEKAATVMKFVHSIVNRVRVRGNISATFIILEGDNLDERIINDINMFSDNIIRL